MPKAPPLYKDHSVAQAHREPRLQRSLPPSFLEALQAKRERGEPHRYTDRDVTAIVRYVSKRPKVDPRYCRFPTDSEVQHHRNQARALGERVRQERTQALADRIEPPTLAERLAAAPNSPLTPIAPKPILIDFKKTAVEDLIAIFRVKLVATITRLDPIYTLTNLRDELPAEHQRVLDLLGDLLIAFTRSLVDRAYDVTQEQWQKLDWGLKEIGKISFKQLRHRYKQIVSEIVRVAGNGYFDWI